MRFGSLLLLICVLMVISDYLSLWHFFGLNNTPEKKPLIIRRILILGLIISLTKKPKVRHLRCWVTSVWPMASPLSRSPLSDVLEVKPVSGTLRRYKRIPSSVPLVFKLSSSFLLSGTVGLVAPGTLLVAGFFKANTQNFSLFCPDKSAEINTQTRIQRYTVFV